MANPEIVEGQPAPAFRGVTQNGEAIELGQFRGNCVVLYFYPKDDTPGCTREACRYRDEEEALRRAGAVVIGVSPDSVKAHGKFAEKFGLKFPLIADTERAVIDAYGVWKKKKFMGREYMGVERSTFVIGPDGVLLRVMRNVKPEEHVDEVLAAVRGVSPRG
jgi:peroxiredoxin Q/BCP